MATNHCKRCGKEISSLGSATLRLQMLREKYGGICPDCITTDEIVEMLELVVNTSESALKYTYQVMIKRVGVPLTIDTIPKDEAYLNYQLGAEISTINIPFTDIMMCFSKNAAKEGSPFNFECENGNIFGTAVFVKVGKGLNKNILEEDYCVVDNFISMAMIDTSTVLH